MSSAEVGSSSRSKRGVADQSEGQADHLALAAGEFERHPVGEGGDVEAFQNGGGGIHPFRRGAPAGEMAVLGQDQEFKHRQPPVQGGEVLRDIADFAASADRRQRADLLILEPDFAAHRQQAAQCPDERGFAGAVAAQDREAGARLRREADILHDLLAAEGDGEVFNLQHGHPGG